MTTRRRRVVLAAALLSCLPLFGMPAAGAAEASVNVHLVSGPTPLPTTGCAAGPRPDVEVEPALAADPLHRGRLVAAWRQDGDEAIGPARIVAASVSSDGNPHNEQALPSDMTCYTNDSVQGEPLAPTSEGSFDTWLSGGPDGTMYLSRVVYGISQPTNPLGGFRVEVVVSHDDGGHWDGPVVVTDDKFLIDDKATITADPTVPGRAYVVWSSYDQTTAVGLPMISRTDDGGVHWTAPAVMAPPVNGTLSASTQLLVLPDGSLVCSMLALGPQPAVAAGQYLTGSTGPIVGLVWVEVTRSFDSGHTWAAPTVVANPSGFALVAAAVGADGAPWLAWSDPAGTLTVAHSTDAGATWSVHVARRSPGLTTPALAVTTGGTVGVFIYDGGEVDPTHPDRTTRARILRSADGGSTWTMTSIGPAFSREDAPDHDLGAYQSLVATGDHFVAALTLPAPAAVLGKSDIFVATL